MLLFTLFLLWGSAQDTAFTDTEEVSYAAAYRLANEGDPYSAEELLVQVLEKTPDNIEARSLLASTLSWNRKYDDARDEFNKITSKERKNRAVWISAIKNELYAKNNATALGLANKALSYFKEDAEVERLRQFALEHVGNQKYAETGWFNQNSGLKLTSPSKNSPEKKSKAKENTTEKEEFKNRFSVSNSFTVFDDRYEPMIFSGISFKHQTKYGSVIPSINYANRSAKQGLQYDVSLYPKLAKRMYAFLNYGYSNASIYPNHKFAGDVYLGLPGAIEVSAGGRHIITDTRNVSSITNSLGHYRGNYYISLRSYITPKPDGLTNVSGNILVRKYLRDAENYFGVNVGLGFSPELRQLTSGNELLAETLLYVESQRLSLAYQFTAKKSPNIYATNVSVRRQELAFESGSFIWAISAGLTYKVKF
ncbi:YaiO family outer membrane beta-barrel protein [Pricia sp.]|uniref:YaiO family outer membrane beta-barrel protein n=1 Tax=Pricia sp. TaxID=2268138 RepID=UPI0035936B7C